jgi:hypothetical protein
MNLNARTKRDERVDARNEEANEQEEKNDCKLKKREKEMPNSIRSTSSVTYSAYLYRHSVIIKG